MQSEVIYASEPKCTLPKMMKNTVNNAIVVFTAHKLGMVVSKGNSTYEVGSTVKDDCAAPDWRVLPVGTKVTLIQE